MHNKFVSQHFNIDINVVTKQIPGYFLLKNLDSVYLASCEKTAKLFGYKNTNEIVGIIDYDIRAEAANYADIFIAEDNQVKHTSKPFIVLNTHTYANNEIKTLLINKYLFKSMDNKAIGIGCYSLEVDDNALGSLAVQLSKNDLKLLEKKYSGKATNYYLSKEYPGLSLSKRQIECLFYLIRGKSARMIAEILRLSPRTVETYIEQIKHKMGCANKTEIIEQAIAKGYADIIPQGMLTSKLKETLER